MTVTRYAAAAFSALLVLTLFGSALYSVFAYRRLKGRVIFHATDHFQQDIYRSTAQPPSSSEGGILGFPVSKVPEATGPRSTAAKLVLVCFDWPTARLGNKMFQYAATLGVARRHRLPAVVMIDSISKETGYNEMKSLFRLTLNASRDTGLLNSAQMISEPGWGIYNAALEDPNTFERPVVTFTGYIQSWKYFEPIQREIREEYALSQYYADLADAFLAKSGGSATSTVVFVGVHVRRGDIAGYPNLYTTAPISYLEKAMKYFLRRFEPNCTVFFAVATDDSLWVKDAVSSIGLNGNQVVHTSGSPEFDFAVLSRCNHSIITAGTFGWWSAYLAGGEVVYYKDFINEHSELFSQYKEQDYYLPSWIGMT